MIDKKVFTKAELRKIRDVASLLTSVNAELENALLTKAAFYLWSVFNQFDGNSIYRDGK